MKYLVVDDHALIRDALRGLLRELDAAAEVLEATTGAAAQAHWRRDAGIDLVLLDLHLPEADGLQLLEAIGRERPGTAVVLLSADTDQQRIRTALALGAQGYIPKSESRDVMRRALELVLAGGVYVPTAALSDLASRTAPAAMPAAAPAPAPAPGATPAAAPAPSPSELGLTDRQLEVLALLMQGKNNKLIGRALDLAEPTVKTHVSAILRALGVASRTEAVLAVSRLGWVLPRTPG